jgi:hypothetical protein
VADNGIEWAISIAPDPRNPTRKLHSAGEGFTMEPVQNPPKSRRRWWMIIALLFALMSVAGWWYRPRGDARFVGKWYHSNPLAVAPIEFTVDLRDDGSGTIRAVNHDPHLEEDLIIPPIRWWVSGNELWWAALGASKSSRLRIVRITDRQILWQRSTDDSDSPTLSLQRVE